MDIFIAQQVEHYTFNVRVMGSNPIEDTAVNPRVHFLLPTRHSLNGVEV